MNGISMIGRYEMVFDEVVLLFNGFTRYKTTWCPFFLSALVIPNWVDLKGVESESFVIQIMFISHPIRGHIYCYWDKKIFIEIFKKILSLLIFIVLIYMKTFRGSSKERRVSGIVILLYIANVVVFVYLFNSVYSIIFAFLGLGFLLFKVLFSDWLSVQNNLRLTFFIFEYGVFYGLILIQRLFFLLTVW